MTVKLPSIQNPYPDGGCLLAAESGSSLLASGQKYRASAERHHRQPGREHKTLQLLMPRGGMQQVATARRMPAAIHDALSNLATIPFNLLQAAYQDVNYTPG